jgi:hypothetical protein
MKVRQNSLSDALEKVREVCELHGFDLAVKHLAPDYTFARVKISYFDNEWDRFNERPLVQVLLKVEPIGIHVQITLQVGTGKPGYDILFIDLLKDFARRGLKLQYPEVTEGRERANIEKSGDARGKSEIATKAINNQEVGSSHILENLDKLRKSICTQFKLEELEILASDLGIDWDELSGTTKSKKVLELIKYLQQRNYLDNLMVYLHNSRPNTDWSTVYQL